MTRMIAMTAIAAIAYTAPALAGEPATQGAEGAAWGNTLTNASAEQQARMLLAHQGYTGISSLDRDENGRWVGTAVKDGKTIFVAVAVPSHKQAATN